MSRKIIHPNISTGEVVLFCASGPEARAMGVEDLWVRGSVTAIGDKSVKVMPHFKCETPNLTMLSLKEKVKVYTPEQDQTPKELRSTVYYLETSKEDIDHADI